MIRANQQNLSSRSGRRLGKIRGGNSNDTENDDDDDDDDNTEELSDELVHGRSFHGSRKKTKNRKVKAFHKGDKVEARYRGQSKWLPGKIRAVHKGNTYNITFDNGKKERKVAHQYVRLAGMGNVSFQVGEHVMAQFGGKFRKYPAKITHMHRDGSFDLIYDDGDTERNVCNG